MLKKEDVVLLIDSIFKESQKVSVRLAQESKKIAGNSSSVNRENLAKLADLPFCIGEMYQAYEQNPAALSPATVRAVKTMTDFHPIWRGQSVIDTDVTTKILQFSDVVMERFLEIEKRRAKANILSHVPSEKAVDILLSCLRDLWSYRFIAHLTRSQVERVIEHVKVAQGKDGFSSTGEYLETCYVTRGMNISDLKTIGSILGMEEVSQEQPISDFLFEGWFACWKTVQTVIGTAMLSPSDFPENITL